MKALVLDKPGPPSDWRIADVPEPSPGANELRVRVHGVGLNPADYKIAAWGHPAWSYPFIMGLDVAGIVESVGNEVSGWRIGDRVYYHGDFSRPGGFAEYACIPAHVVAPMPEGLTFVEAAAVPCSGFAAYQGVYRRLKLEPGMTVLVQGGAGGVGGYAVQFCAYAGARVIATTSAQNAAYVTGLGAQHTIDYRTEDVSERVLELTKGRGVDAVIDTVSQATTSTAFSLIAFGGHIVCVDSLPDFSYVRPFDKAFSLHEIALGVAHLSGDRTAQEDLARIGKELGDLIQQGHIRVTLNKTVSLEAVPEALDQLAGRHVRGKIVARLMEEPLA